MSKAGANAVVALEDKTFFHDIELAAQRGIKEDVSTAMAVFAGK
jgi:hypothetical protein